MNVEQVFSLAGTIAAAQWLLLIFLPKWKVTQWLVAYPVVPALLSAIYCIYITGFFSVRQGGYNSLQQVRHLFANDALLLAGWVHYLAFDLLIGFSILQSARLKGISHWLIALFLVLTFMFGPVGYLLFQIIKNLKSHENLIEPHKIH